MPAACAAIWPPGTDEPYVLDEAAALGITGYFAGIYGAQDDYKSFSKKILIERIIAEHTWPGRSLSASATALSRSRTPSRWAASRSGWRPTKTTPGRIDAWKRNRADRGRRRPDRAGFRRKRALLI